MSITSSSTPAFEITDNQLYFPSTQDNNAQNNNNLTSLFERLAERVSEKTLLEKGFLDKNALLDKNNSLSQNIANLKKLYKVSKKKATSLIQKERDVLISQPSVNGLIGRYVVKNVKEIQDMSVVLNEDNFILLLNLKAKGVTTRVSASFELLNFTFNHSTQQMLYRQLSQTHIEEMYYDSFMTQLKVKLALMYLKYIKKRDLLGFVFETIKVASVKTRKELITSDTAKQFDDTILGDEITIHLERFFNSNSMKKQLSRFQISGASIKNHKLAIRSKVNLEGFIQDEPTDIT